MAARACFALLVCLAAGGASAQLVRENELAIESRGLADLRGGLLLDATVTVLGQDFFASFAAAWRELDSLQRYSLTLSELPSARFGSTLSVAHDGQILFKALVGPNRQAARERAQAIAGDIFQLLLRREAESALFRDADLGPEELP